VFQSAAMNLARLSCISLVLLAAPGTAQTGTKSKEPSQLTKLADGVFAHVVNPDGNAVANAGIVVLDHSVLVFDTHYTPEAGQELSSLIRAVTAKPVRYVVNSHFHPDHTHGNQAFPGALVISGAVTRREILQKDVPALNRSLSMAEAQLQKLRKEVDQPGVHESAQTARMQINSRQEFLNRMAKLKITPPTLAFDRELIIRDGARTISLLYLGSGHTEGDIVLFLPSEKIAFVGDLLFNAALPNTQDAAILEWKKTLEQVLKLDADKFVPGHGPVGSRRDVEAFLGYFKDLENLVLPPLSRGEAVDQILKDLQIPGQYSSYRFQNFFPANVQKIYTELKGQQVAASSGASGKPEPERPTP
jgi:cyclase